MDQTSEPANAGGADGLFDRVLTDKQERDEHNPEAGRYPHSPGWRRGPNNATSKAAAKLAGERAAPLKERVLAMLSEAPATPEELVERFSLAGERVLLNTARARVSDLHALGRVCPSGTFGLGESGKARVIRWRAATAEEAAIAAARRAADAEPGERANG